MRFFLKTYGCTFSRANSDKIYCLVKSRLSNYDEANCVILNTCGVKEQTEKKIIDEIKRINGKKILIFGCLPYIRKDILEIDGIKGKDIEIFGLDFERLKERLSELGLEDEETNRFIFTTPIARIQIAKGCLSKCSYCATKFATGMLQSKKKEEIIEEIRMALSAGCMEIQLTGQDLGCYGIDIDTSLESLLKKIEKIEGNFKVRIGMINPKYIKRIPEEIFCGKKIYHFLHLPVQSGSNEVLDHMGRGYKIEDVESYIEEKRREFSFSFETDVIVGYPTETNEDYAKTYEFIKRIRPDVVNVTKFSKRPGTEAAKLKNINSRELKRRSKDMAALCRKISYEVNKSLIGREYSVLVQEKKEGEAKGRNENYKQVVIKRNLDYGFYKCKIVSATITSLIAD
jgi:threonylcarbamoyladenosine tRNA methylthiotransferase CDKAL1